MLATSRPFVAAGVAMVGATAIAISPVTLPQLDIRTEAAIHLTASPEWQDVLSTAGQNASALLNAWLAAPAPILQQIVANQQKYLSELPDLARIGSQLQANVQRALGVVSAADPTTLDGTHRTLYELLPAVLQLPGIPTLLQFTISATGQQLLAVSTTALSGVLLGLAGPVLGPLMVLQSSLGQIAAGVSAQTPDLAGAVSTLAAIPVAMTDAFLNGGQRVDLTALAQALGPSIGVTFPDGVQVGIALGGLLSPGGSIFNALDLAYDNNLLGVLHIHVPLATGTGVGPLGAMRELAEAIAKAIGWNGAPSTSAARSALAAADEVPASVLSSTPKPAPVRAAVAADIAAGGPSGTARSARHRDVLADNASHPRTAAAANRSVGGAQRENSSTATSGRPSTAMSKRTATR